MLFENFEPRKTLKLIGYQDKFLLLRKLIESQKFPKALLLSGEKGIGKFTLISHLMHYYFDKQNYDFKNYTIKNVSSFSNQFLQNIFPNILYLHSSDIHNLRIEDIRKLKINLQKTPLNNEKRFIIFDDIELFNLNSVNALLKIIEEPSDKNYFILINNKTKPLIQTISSRCLELRIFFNKYTKDNVIAFLTKFFNQKVLIEKDLIQISPGNFIKFNYIFVSKNININEKFIENLNNLINLYKKDKDIFYKDLILFFIDYYFQSNKYKMIVTNKKIFEKKTELVRKIDQYFVYNLNQNNLLTFLENNFLND